MCSTRSAKFLIFIGCFLLPRMAKCELASTSPKEPNNIPHLNRPHSREESQDAMIQNVQLGLEELFANLFGIRSPSYYQKLLQLNGNPNKESSLDPNPRTLLFSNYRRPKVPSRFPPPAIETIVSEGHGMGRVMPLNSDIDYLNNWWVYNDELQPNNFEIQGEPIFSPYVSTEALQNMNRYFQRVRENQRALLKMEQQGKGK